MKDKNQSRLRRARQTRLRIRELGAVRLTVHRTNVHIYAQITSAAGDKVLLRPPEAAAPTPDDKAKEPGKGAPEPAKAPATPAAAPVAAPKGRRHRGRREV